MTLQKKVTVIDDEQAIRKLLETALRDAGYHTVVAATGREGLVCVAHHAPEIVVLDLGLPDMDGLEVLDRLREWTDVPVIVLTVRDDPAEKVAALEAGADDFVTKPFHTGELLARIRTVARRSQPAEQEARVQVGRLCIDFLEHRVMLGEETVDLTPIEFRFLQILARHAGKIVTKTHLIREIWGATTSSTDDHLRVHLAAIRRKLRAYRYDQCIQTETGVGYRLRGDTGEKSR